MDAIDYGCLAICMIAVFVSPSARDFRARYRSGPSINRSIQQHHHRVDGWVFWEKKTMDGASFFGTPCQRCASLRKKEE